jgi:anti-anti-sigma factor
MNPLQVDIREVTEGVVVCLKGDAGLLAAQELEAPLQRIVARQPPLVVFDVAGLEFAASLFLGTLVNFRRGIVAHGGRVLLAGARARLLEVLQISRLDQLFELTDAPPQTVAS